VEYLKDSVEISVCIRDEQTEFDAENVFLEYRAANTEKWNLFDTKEQIWDNPEENVFEIVYEFNGLENAEIAYEFRITYVDNAENNMVLGNQVQAEKIEECEGTYLAKKQIIIDNLSPAYEVRYQNEMEEELLSSEDDTELSPYYNAANEVMMDFVIKESYLDMENTKISIIATNLKGTVIHEEVPKLIGGKFQANLKEDGHYLIRVHLVDMAGNKTLHEKKFALDHTPPKQPIITYKTDSQSLLERVWNQLTFGYFSKEKQVFREFARAAKTVLDNGGTVLLDATHLNIYSVKKILNALQWNEEFGIIRLEVPLEVLLERNDRRFGRQYVPEDKLIEMFNKLDDATKYCDNVWIIGDISREVYNQ
jgi:hypothetical protein